jgi:hypothetical protein
MSKGIVYWLRRLFRCQEGAVNASHGGVAILGDNLGGVFTGQVNLVSTESEEEADERQWEQCIAASASVVHSASAQRLASETVVAVNLIEVDPKSDAGERAEAAESVRTPITADRVIELIATGRNIVIFGEGGIGKTTAALRFAKSLLEEHPPRRLPIFIDAPAWTNSNREPFEFMASLPSYAAAGMTAARLSRYANHDRLTLFIDGWNEISAASQESCSQRMRAFIDATPGINIVLTTRNTLQRPETASPVLVGVAGIDWQHQQEYIRERLPAAEANALVDQLSVQHRLRHAARNPLVLQGVVSLKSRNQTIANAFMVYRAIVETYEREGPRSAALAAPPLHGLHNAYLESLAWRMNADGGTALPAAVARPILAKEVESLQSSRQIFNPVEPSQLLHELCDHHLLFLEHGLVKFAHQRFQEYFAAKRYLSLLDARDAEHDSNLLEPLEDQAWEDTLLLVAAKLSSEAAPSAARLALVRAAITIDLHFTCVIAAAAGFDRRDDATTFDELVATVNRVVDSSDSSIVGYGLACMIDSTLPAFSQRTWDHLEQADQQQRLHFYRCGSNPISIRQLGPDASARLLTWSVDRHAEFIHEIAGNAANWEYLVDCAFNASLDELRIAAISAIRWEYPASDVALQAWLCAPDAVKLGDGLIGLLEEDLIEGSEEVHTELRRVHAMMSDERAHRLALRFQPILPSPPTAYLLDLLRGDRTQHASETALALMSESDPERLDALAVENIFSTAYPAEWAVDRIRLLDADTRSSLFGRALQEFSEVPSGNYAADVIVPCANHDQASAVLRDYLALHSDWLSRRRDFDNHDKHSALRSLLLHMDGEMLVVVSIELAKNEDSWARHEIAELIRNRSDDTLDNHTRTPWTPSIDQTSALIDALMEDIESGSLMCALADIASRVDANHYQSLIKRCCQWELDEWSTYRVAINRWVDAGGIRERPTNPSNRITLPRILARWGVSALPFLRTLVDHPEADQFVFSAMAIILQQRWQLKLRHSSASRLNGIDMSRIRLATGRVMLQPDSELQDETDAISSQLAERLSSQRHLLEDQSIPERDRRRIRSRVVALTLALARIPSPVGALPVLDAITSGSVEGRAAIDATASLLEQGLSPDHPGLVSKLCEMWESMATRRWLDQSQAYEFKNLSHTILRLPHALLPNPAAYYLERWLAVDGGHDVANRLAADGSKAAFDLLCSMLQRSDGDSHRHQHIAHSIVSALSAATWQQFVEVVADGTFFGRSSGLWHLDNVAASIQAKLGELPDAIAAILKACAGNPSRAAVRLGCLLLQESHSSDEKAHEFAASIFTADNVSLDASSPLEFTRLFFRKQALEAGAYRILPVASNQLRMLFFSIAGSESRFSRAARALLCEIEAERRESGHPAKEPRHPDRRSGISLADALTG